VGCIYKGLSLNSQRKKEEKEEERGYLQIKEDKYAGMREWSALNREKGTLGRCASRLAYQKKNSRKAGKETRIGGAIEGGEKGRKFEWKAITIARQK